MDQLADLTLHYYIYIFNSNYTKIDTTISLIIMPRDELVARGHNESQSVTHQLWRDSQRVLSSEVNHAGGVNAGFVKQAWI